MKRLLKEEKRELIEILESFKEKMLKFSHHKDCEDYDECPAHHSKCKNKLNIATAMLWDIAKEELSNYIDNINTDKFNKLYEIVNNYYWLLDTHRQYHKMTKIETKTVEDAFNILDNLLWELDFLKGTHLKEVEVINT